jgi:hypothetical protein
MGTLSHSKSQHTVSALLICLAHLVLAFDVTLLIISFVRPHFGWTKGVGSWAFGLFIVVLILSIAYLAISRRLANSVSRNLDTAPTRGSHRTVIFVAFLVDTVLFIGGLALLAIAVASKASVSDVRISSGLYFEHSDAGTVPISVDRYYFILKIDNLWFPAAVSLLVISVVAALLLSERLESRRSDP